MTKNFIRFIDDDAPLRLDPMPKHEKDRVTELLNKSFDQRPTGKEKQELKLLLSGRVIWYKK